MLEGKLLRTVRVRNVQKPGTLGHLLVNITELTPPNDLVPNPLDKSVHHAVARAVAKKAIEQGLARAEFVPYTED